AFRTSRFLVSPVVERKQIPSEEAGGGSGGRVIQQQEETITSTPNPLMDDSPKSDSITASSTAALPVPTSSASIVLLPSQDQQQNDGWVSGVGMTVASSVATSQPGSGGPTPPHHCTPENTYTSDHQAKLSQQNSLEKSDSVTANSNLSELARKLQQLGTSGGTVPPLSLSSSHTLPPMSAPLSAPSHPGTPISLATQPTFSQELSMQLAGGGSGSVDGSILTTTSLGVPVQEANVVMQPQGPHYTNRTTDIPTTELIQQGVQSMGIDDGRAITTPPITSDSVGTPLVTPAGVLMTAPIPVEAVGIPVNTDMFPSLKPTPQPIINSTAMHHITSLPPEMSAPGVSIPPEMGVSVEQSGHTDTSQVTLQSQAAELGCSGGEPGHVPGDGHVGVEAHYVPVVPGHITMGLAPGTPTAVPAGMTPGMSMTGATLGLHHGVMLAVPTGSGQRSRMDLNALREQLQKLVPGARLTLAHHDTEESVTTGSPSIDGLQPVYPQPSAIGGIPLTVMGSNRVEDIMPMGHGEGLHTSLDGSVDTSMILPHTVRLPGGETVALVPQVMMEGRCPSTLGYSTMVPLNLEKASAFNTVGSEEAYAWRSAGVSPAPLQSTIPLSRTPSLLDSEEQVDKQTRTSRFQVTKVVEESVRRASDTSTCSSPVSSPVRRGRFAVTKVAESAESGECALGGSALTPGLSESHPHVFFRGDSQGGTPSEPPSITASAAPSMTSSFVSEDTPATTPATPAADLETFTQHRSTANNSTEDCAPTIEGSQFSGVVTRLPGDRWQPQSQPSSSSCTLPMQTHLCEEATVSPSTLLYPHNSNTAASTSCSSQGCPASPSSATNQQAKVNAFKNSRTTNFNVPVGSPVHGTPILSQIVEQPFHPLSTSSLPPSEPPPILKLPSRLCGTAKKKSHGIGGGAIPKLSETTKTTLTKLKVSRSTSYDADTEEVFESLLDSQSDGRAHTLYYSRSVEVQTEEAKEQERNLSSLSPSLTVKSSLAQRPKPKSTSSLTSPVPPPIPPRNTTLKSPIKKAGSVNWLDRSSSILDLGNLFEEVKQSREALHKSRESLSRSVEKSTFSVYSPLSRTKSVSNIQHLGLASTRDSGLSQSSWELGDANNSAPHFHSLRAGNSINFNEIQKSSMLSPSSNIKRSPALRRLTGQDRFNISVEDSVYHTVHTPSHASANPRAKSSGPTIIHTPAFQEDVYYTIQGGAGVTHHYQTEESRQWQVPGSVPLYRQRSYCHSSCSSSEEGFEEDDPLYEPLHESPRNMSPTEAYKTHYALETPHLSPRSPKYYYHHSPPLTSHYIPLSPKSPKHLRYSPKPLHPYGHSPHQLYQSPQCSPQPSHYSPQSYHYPCTCMHQSYPNPLSSRPWPSPTAQLETGRSCSWTEDDELETVRLDLEDFSEDDDSFQQLLSKQEHEEAELRRRHQQEREAFKVQRMQRSHQNKRPKSLRLASSPGPPPSGLSPTSPHCHTDCMQMEDCKLSVRTNADSVLSDSSLETSVAATSSKKGRTISEDMLELVQNLGAPRQVIRPSPGKITLNQMMGQQKSSATVPPIGQRSFYPSVGIAAAQYHGQFLSNFQTFPLPYQRLSDGSAVAVSQADDGAGVPSSTSSSSTNLQQQQQQQLPPVSSASWVHWQQQ
ncbi:hypothetical protein OTU49_015106, partial [Cherax quadricarinatus]